MCPPESSVALCLTLARISPPGCSHVQIFCINLPFSYLTFKYTDTKWKMYACILFFTHTLSVPFVSSGCLKRHLRSRPGPPGCTGIPQTNCGHRVCSASGLPSPEDNSHSISTQNGILFIRNKSNTDKN